MMKTLLCYLKMYQGTCKGYCIEIREYKNLYFLCSMRSFTYTVILIVNSDNLNRVSLILRVMYLGSQEILKFECSTPIQRLGVTAHS